MKNSPKRVLHSNLSNLWLELKEENRNPVIIGGFYREWTHDGDKTEEGQVKRIKIFSNQIELANKNKCEMIILGDANLCSNKWNNSKFLQKNVAAPLKIALDRCGLLFKDIGNTYQSDHIVANGSVPESALDHVYSSKSLEDKIEVKKLSNGSSDHNPVAVSIHKHPCLRLLMNKLLTYLLT